ncbi:MAG: DMT family transporter [Acetobacterales bacterium]
MSRPGDIVGRLPRPVQAALAMTVATLCASVVNGFMRSWSQEFHPFQVAFFRLLFGLVFVMPMLLHAGRTALRTQRHGLLLLRGCLTAALTAGWVVSLQFLPVDKATALNFTVPIWATIGAALFLHETVGPRRWAAVAVGALGSLVILRPGLTDYEPASIVPLLVAGLMAAVMLIVRSLGRTESPVTIMIYMYLYAPPFLLLPALWVWQAPSAGFLLATLAMAGIGTVGMTMYTLAFGRADASVVAPFDFLRLPFGAMVGLIWFGELMDFWSWIGAGVILVSSAYIAQREASARGVADGS